MILSQITLRPALTTPAKIVAPHPVSIPACCHACCSPPGTCDVRGVMLHPVRVPPASGSLPPWMFPREIPSAALHTKQQVPSGGRSRASPILGSLVLAFSARNMPPARRAAVPAYPRFRSASPPPASPPPPPKDAPRPASGIVCRQPLTDSFLAANLSHLIITGARHTMPPARQDSRLNA